MTGAFIRHKDWDWWVGDLTPPKDDKLASAFLSRCLTGKNQDMLRMPRQDLSLSQQTQLVIEHYERCKPILFDCDSEWII